MGALMLQIMRKVDKTTHGGTALLRFKNNKNYKLDIIPMLIPIH